MYPDDVQWLDGRWLALSDGSRDSGYVQFKVVVSGPGFTWERGRFLGRIRRVAPELVVEEKHWSLDDRGVLRLDADGWDEIDDLDLADPRLSVEGVAVGAWSVRWMSDEEVAAVCKKSPLTCG
ncbi:hypothetical protein IT882_10155 [Microbacterium schleiferi]|uniref:Uncharacterized protein n=1 Tax=Microbacterium schleiferi TaxID=69362 RepID=A0A7S8MVE7_9MICO|nr:hypothetical protein [Microbacterium schleiferi]QPE03668.1 hypothetical protein IT882_10155 [Microbacterium schleiferi]